MQQSRYDPIVFGSRAYATDRKIGWDEGRLNKQTTPSVFGLSGFSQRPSILEKGKLTGCGSSTLQHLDIDVRYRAASIAEYLGTHATPTSRTLVSILVEPKPSVSKLQMQQLKSLCFIPPALIPNRPWVQSDRLSRYLASRTQDAYTLVLRISLLRPPSHLSVLVRRTHVHSCHSPQQRSLHARAVDLRNKNRSYFLHGMSARDRRGLAVRPGVGEPFLWQLAETLRSRASALFLVDACSGRR